MLITGADLTTVMQAPRPPQETTTTTAPATTTTTTGPTLDPGDEVLATTTTLVGVVPGEAPPGVAC